MTDITSKQVGTTNDGEQMVRVLPTDSNTVQLPSSQPLSIRRNFSGITISSHTDWDGTQDTTIKGGELATLLKLALVGFKGVDLESLRMFVTCSKAGGSIAFCLCTAAEGILDYKDVYRSVNSKVLGFNVASINQRMEVELQMPTGLGQQLVPCDPVHPAINMYVATKGKFAGTLSIYYKIACDVVMIKLEDNCFL